MRVFGMVVIGLVLAAGTDAPALAQVKTYTKVPVGSGWRIDTQHSEVSFRIRHLVGRVRGQFTSWEGLLVTKDQDWSHSFPEMTFESTGLIQTNTNFEMGGLMTIKGHTHPVVFRGQYRGIERDQNGKERIAFDGTALINRRDYGLTWNQTVESGAMLSDAVELEIAIEAVRL